MLEIINLSKSYGAKKAVDSLSLCVAPGEICAFIGHNGAGKTTTLKCIAGILPFEAGEIKIDGISIQDDPLRCKRLFAYLPDEPTLYPFMTGAQYLNFVCDIFGISRQERADKITGLAALYGISGDLSKPIQEYSHGMKQKLAIISALIHDPRLIIMDEPLTGLDPKATHTLKTMLRAHCEKGGSVFFSTHILDVAEKLCDRVAMIREGRLIAAGSMAEVRGAESLETVFLELEEGNHA